MSTGGEGMSTGRGGLGAARTPARGCRGDLFGGHDERQGDDDVLAPGADGAVGAGPGHELAQRVRQASLDPVSDDHPGAERGAGKKLLGQRHW